MGYRLEDIKEQLGHTSIKTTEKFYASLYDENKKSMARNMNKLIKYARFFRFGSILGVKKYANPYFIRV